jgi:hypothetical protein
MLQNCITFAQEWEAAAVRFWQDMNDPAHPFRPWFAVQPKREQVWAWYDIPESYIPLIQNEAMVGLACTEVEQL